MQAGNGHDDLGDPEVPPAGDLLGPRADVLEVLRVGEPEFVRLHHPLAAEIREAAVLDAGVERSLQLERGRVAPDLLAALPDERHDSGASSSCVPTLRMSAYFAASRNVTFGPRPAAMIFIRRRPTLRGELSMSWTRAYWPSNENGGSPLSSIFVMISKCSVSAASRSLSDGNSKP